MAEIGKRRSRECRYCGTSGLVWHKSAEGFALYPGRQDSAGRWYPDLSVAAHHCKGNTPGWGHKGGTGARPDVVVSAAEVSEASADTGEGEGEATPSESPNPSNPQPQPIPMPQGDLAQSLAQALAPTLQAIAKNAADAAVKSAIANLPKPEPSQVTHIIKRDGRPDEAIQGEHPLFAKLLAYLGAGEHVLLYGAPGGGKSTAAHHAADVLFSERAPEDRYGYLSLNPQTADSRVNGFIDAQGIFRDTVFYQRYSKGGVFCFDEIDNASDNLLTSLNGALENGLASFPSGMVKRHAEFLCVATANTACRGGDRRHSGRRPLDAATRDRFTFIEWTYDEALEDRLALAENPEAKGWITWVRKVRAHAAIHYPDLVVSPRASVKGAKLLAKGAITDLPELAHDVLFKGLDKDSVRAIVDACPLPKAIEASNAE